MFYPVRRSTPLYALFLIALLASMLLAGCGAPAEAPRPGQVVATEKGEYRNLTAVELNTMMEKKDFFLVDVHVPNEGQLPEVDARIPFDKIQDELDRLPADKDAKIVLTCKGGGMSAKASTALADLGYTNVYNLDGGFNAWVEAGFALSPQP